MHCIHAFLIQYDTYIAIHPEVIVLTSLHFTAKQQTTTAWSKHGFRDMRNAFLSRNGRFPWFPPSGRLKYPKRPLQRGSPRFNGALDTTWCEIDAVKYSYEDRHAQEERNRKISVVSREKPRRFQIGLNYELGRALVVASGGRVFRPGRSTS